MSPALLRSLCAAAGLALAVPFAAAEQTTVAGSPLGVMADSLTPGNHALAFPLLSQELFVGLIAGNADNTVTFASGTAAAHLVADGQYYLEIATGPFEGERLDLDTAGTLAAGGATVKVNLSATSSSTTPSLDANVLASARAVVRQHVTLQSLQAMFSPAFVGNNNSALADGVEIYRAGILYSFYLRSDGATWREAGKTTDVRSMVIPPDSALIVQLRSGTKRWTHAGDVRTNVFRVNLPVGARIFATGFPLDLTPAGIGAFTDTGAPAAVRWVGNDNPALADNLRIYNPATNTFLTYYLAGDGVSWYLSGGGTNLANTPLLGATGMAVLTRTNAEPDYLIFRPFSL